MGRIQEYLIGHFLRSLLTIFLPFFMIVTLVYLVKISSLSSQIEISFLEMLKLYSYSIPDIVFYTLPLSFIAALGTTLSRLSFDNELISLFALGVSSKKILLPFGVLAFSFSVFLFTLAFVAIPTSTQLYKAYKEEKKANAKIHLIPGKLGQKFGNYYIYVKSESNGRFNDAVIYSRDDEGKERFFSARHATLIHETNRTRLKLTDGYGYTYDKEKLQEAQYRSLEVFDYPESIDFRFQDILTYWLQAKENPQMLKKTLFFLFISLIPLLALFLVSAFSIVNPRYQNNVAFLVSTLNILFFYLVASYLQKQGTLIQFLAVVLSIFVVGFWLFKTRIERFF